MAVVAQEEGSSQAGSRAVGGHGLVFRLTNTRDLILGILALVRCMCVSR